MIVAIQAGDIRVAEAIASEYFGPEVGSASHRNEREIYPIPRWKRVRVFGNPDLPHSWTFVPDTAVALVTLGTEPRALGKAWHVPTNPPIFQRQVFAATPKLANIKDPVVESNPCWQLNLAALFSPLIRDAQRWKSVTG